MSDLKRSVSFVVPCLNEQETLSEVLTKIRQLCLVELKAYQTEVVVCDNGSTDNSVKIAQEHGAKVVHCAEKGYGAALLSGIKNAACEIVVFADADNTYDFLEAPLLVYELEKGFDLVVGSRLQYLTFLSTCCMPEVQIK
jgi:glycosyltransferase involved in cell wall biosynthesis